MDTDQLESIPRAHAIRGFATFGGLVTLAAATGIVTTPVTKGVWYRTLRKPPYQPPSWLFGPVWTTLYTMTATSGYRVWRTPPSPARSKALALWGLQLGLNALWSPLFFGRRAIRSALVDSAALTAAVAVYTVTARRVDRVASVLTVPYLAWSCFATVLNAAIVRRNR